jgi:hypothetical protein
MELKKSVVLFLFAITTSVAHAQERTAIQGFATFTPGFFLNHSENSYSLHGELEVQLNEKVSVIGDGFYTLKNSHATTTTFEYNHNVMEGMTYHLWKSEGENNLDTYVGIEPGIAISKLNKITTSNYPKTSINPVVSLLVGAQFQLTKHLYLFGQVRYLGGSHVETEFHRLDEIRISTGLGFTFWSKN